MPKSFFILASTIALVVSSGNAFARPEIVINGLERSSENVITSRFPNSEKYTESDLDNVVKDIFATGIFSDVKISKQGSKIIVTVKETEVPASITFSGNKRLKDEKLLSSVGIEPGVPFGIAQLSMIESRIEQEYARTGRRNARVTADVVRRDLGFYDLTFFIDEGQRASIDHIWVSGNTTFSSNKILSVIDLRKTRFFSKILSNDIADTRTLERDRQSIIDFYRSKGFHDVVVSPAEVDFNDDNTEIMVGYRIEEGIRYEVGDVSIDNSTAIVIPQRAAREIDRLQGRLFTTSKVEEVAQTISRMVRNDTGEVVVVTPRPTRLATGVADVTFTVDKADRRYIERIEVSGNELTREYVIRREFDLSEGDLLDKRLIADAERRLKRLGFFESVNASILPGANNDRVVVAVNVVEKKTGEISVGGAYSETTGATAILSLSKANFGGTGRHFSGSIGQGEDAQTYSFSFTEPYVFGQRMSSTLSVFKQDLNKSDESFRPYDEVIEGGRISLSGEITRFVDLQVYYSILFSGKTDIEPSMAKFISKTDRVTSSTGYELSYNNLDRDTNPTDGLYVKFGQEFAGLGGDVSFVRTEIEGRAYKELSERNEIVGSIGVKAGYVASLGDDLSFEDHFRMGSNLVRGFSVGGIGARDAATGYLFGNQFYAGASAEIMYPIPVITDGIGIRGTVFADAGTVWGVDHGALNSSGAITDSSAYLRASFGTGLVWDSPLGLLKASVAYPVSKKSYDDTQIFSVSGGSRF